MTEYQIENLYSFQEVSQVAQVYAEVFAGPPWNESTFCPNCQEFFGQDTAVGNGCLSCSAPLRAAYPKDQTVSYIKKEANREGYTGKVAKAGDQTIGFAWGYLSSPKVLVAEKYKTEAMQEDLLKLLASATRGSSRFFYISECGVLENFRGNGISNQLMSSLFSAPAAEWPLVMRTNESSPMVAVAKKFGLEQIFGPVVDYDATRRMLRATGQIANGIDRENPARVLFARYNPPRGYWYR